VKNIANGLISLLLCQSLTCHSRAGFDENGDGAIDKQELVAFMHSLKLPLTLAEAHAVLHYIDKDDSGKIECDELYKAVRQIHKDEIFLRQMMKVSLYKQTSTIAQMSPYRQSG
jgi:EF-hand domain pair